MKAVWFTCGWLLGMMTLSLTMASVPKSSRIADRITDDTALYQRVSEIRVGREPAPNFDGDIDRLTKKEHRYQESFLLRDPIRRINSRQYVASSRLTPVKAHVNTSLKTRRTRR